MEKAVGPPGRLRSTRLELTSVCPAPASAMPMPDSGGAASGPSPLPSQTALFAITRLPEMDQPVAGPGAPASTSMPTQLPDRKLSRTVPSEALRMRIPSASFRVERLPRMTARASCSSPT